MEVIAVTFETNRRKQYQWKNPVKAEACDYIFLS